MMRSGRRRTQRGWAAWRRVAAIAPLLVLAGMASPSARQLAPPVPATHGGRLTAAETERRDSARVRVDEAAAIACTLSATPGMAGLLARARGVFIVPRYGRAALAVGIEGGAGVFLMRRADGSWSNPAFFNLGGIGIGLQAGLEGGSVAFVLLDQRAADSFSEQKKFSLSADAGLTVIDFSLLTQQSTKGDIIAWSGTHGLFGNLASIAANDVEYNEAISAAYYGRRLAARQALESEDTDAQLDKLRRALGHAARTGVCG